jgi:predicted small lipoprotein YifL
MKRLFLLLLVLILAACGGTPNNNTPPDDSNTQVTDGFKITYTPADNFYVAKGSTGTLQITADITKPDAIARLNVYVSDGPTYLTVSPKNLELRNGETKTIQVAVSATAEDTQKPYLKVSVYGENAKGDPVTEQVVKDFIWTF